MPPNTDEKLLEGLFSKYGDIVSVAHKGNYAFVEFALAEDAEVAIKEVS